MCGWVARFFVWTTVFALFNTSIFWSLMADVFRSDQAKRMFGFIGVGGTFGSIVGSAGDLVAGAQDRCRELAAGVAGFLEIAILIVTSFPLVHGGDGNLSGVAVDCPACAAVSGRMTGHLRRVVGRPRFSRRAILFFRILLGDSAGAGTSVSVASCTSEARPRGRDL